MPPGAFRLPGKIKPPDEVVWVAPSFVLCATCRKTSPVHFDYCGACGEPLVIPQAPKPKINGKT